MLYLFGVYNKNPLLEAYSVDVILLNVSLMITTYKSYKNFFYQQVVYMRHQINDQFIFKKSIPFKKIIHINCFTVGKTCCLYIPLRHMDTALFQQQKELNSTSKDIQIMPLFIFFFWIKFLNEYITSYLFTYLQNFPISNITKKKQNN